MNFEENKKMMKEQLYDILAQVTDISSQIDGMNYILNILKEVYETQNQMELFYCVQMFEKYNANLEKELVKVRNEIDEFVLNM